MSTRDELFPSKYIKHSDLNGQEVTVTIASLDMEEVGMDKEEKPVLSFKDAKKKLVLNMTNFDGIAESYGEETDNWPGEKIILYEDKARYGGKIVDCIRVKPAKVTAVDYQQAKQGDIDPQAPLETATAEVEISDSIPF